MASSVDPHHHAVWEMRQNPLVPTEAIYRQIYNYIWRVEIEAQGVFIKTIPDERSLLFSGATRKAYELNLKNDALGGYLFMRYGLLMTEEITKHVVAALRAYANIRGIPREVRRFVHYDRETQVLYVSCYDGTAWRLDGVLVEKVLNGQGVLFVDDDGGVGVPDAVIGPNDILFPALVNSLQYVNAAPEAVEAQQLALITWIFALAFPDLLPAKPMLLVEGESGSGKTSCVQLIQRALWGKSRAHIVGRHDEKDFAVQILRSPIALLDNTDSFVDWLQDALCAYATSGEWGRRKLYADTDYIEIRPHSFIAITSRNPVTFKRDDVAERLIILRLARREANIPTSMLFDGILRNRREIFGEWLYYLNLIVGEIRARNLEANVNLHRLADWAKIAHAVGAVLGYPQATVDNMLAAIQTERDVLVSDGEPVVDMLDHWLEDQKNSDREITAGDLFRELVEIAHFHRRTFYRSPSSLAQKLRSKHVAQYFRVRFVGENNGSRVYAIKRAKE